MLTDLFTRYSQEPRVMSGLITQDVRGTVLNGHCYQEPANQVPDCLRTVVC